MLGGPSTATAKRSVHNTARLRVTREVHDYRASFFCACGVVICANSCYICATSTPPEQVVKLLTFRREMAMKDKKAREVLAIMREVEHSADHPISVRVPIRLLELFDVVAKYTKSARSKAIRQYIIDVVYGRRSL